jgi:hypothetical protein
MSTDRHPSALELEALHAGEGSPATAQHARSCPVCQAYQDELAAEAARFTAGRDADAFVRALRARADAATDAASAGRRRRLAALSLALSGVAAAVALWIGLGRPSMRGDQIGMRGGIQVAALVLHDGVQVRKVGAISGAPGDKFRVEIALSAPAALDVMLVDEGGRVVVLSDGRRFEPGTHYLEPAMTFDDRPTKARLLVGPAGTVRRAVSGPPEPGVVVIPIRGDGSRP